MGKRTKPVIGKAERSLDDMVRGAPLPGTEASAGLNPTSGSSFKLSRQRLFGEHTTQYFF